MPAPSGLIAQVWKLAQARLAAGLDKGLTALPDDLHALGARSEALAEHRILAEAIAQVRTSKDRIVAAFEREFGALLDTKSRRGAAAAQTPAAMSLSQATLVDDAAMEQQIALGYLVRKTRYELDSVALFAVETRVGELIAGERLEGGANPVGPEAVIEALQRACAGVPADGAVKTALLNGLQPHIGFALGGLYEELNELLRQQGVVPKIRHAVEKSAYSRAGGPSGGAGGGGGAGGAGEASGGAGGAGGAGARRMTLSQALSLRELLPGSTSSPIDLAGIVTAYLQGPPEMRQYGARMLANPEGSLFAHAMATPVNGALLAELSALQGVAAPGASLAQGSGDLLAVLQHLVRTQHHPLDQLTGELVAVAFDYILHDRDIAEPAKIEIARLQIVAFKAALIDRSFFARREHPLRGLLAAIAAAATDPQIDASLDGRFVQGLRAMVDEVVAGFTDDLAIFTTASERLAALVAELHGESEQEVAVLAAKLAEEERAAQAQAHAEAEIAQRAQPSAPEFVRQFLAATWTRVLAAAAAHDRADDRGWDAQLQVVDDLLWSVEPKQAADVPRLAAMLPKLVVGLSGGMKAVDISTDTQQAFLDELMRTHTALLQAARTRRAPVPQKPAPTPAPAAKAAETIAAPELAAHATLSIERGAMVEFADVDAPVRARLMWISPQRTLYVFIVGGLKTRRMSPGELAAALRAGTARVVEEGSAIVERALEATAHE